MHITKTWIEEGKIITEVFKDKEVYKQPWVGLADKKGVLDFGDNHVTTEFAKGALWAESRLKELNNGK